jgi:uncharacterized protein (TIGR02246 family)
MGSASPEELSAAFAAAINAGDVRAALELWSEDAAIVSPGGQTVRGRAAIEGVLHALIGNGTTVEIDVFQLISAGDAAIATGELRMRLPGHAEVQSTTSVVVYARAPDGSWQVAIDAPWGLPATAPG